MVSFHATPATCSSITLGLAFPITTVQRLWCRVWTPAIGRLECDFTSCCHLLCLQSLLDNQSNPTSIHQLAHLPMHLFTLQSVQRPVNKPVPIHIFQGGVYVVPMGRRVCGWCMGFRKVPKLVRVYAAGLDIFMMDCSRTMFVSHWDDWHCHLWKFMCNLRTCECVIVHVMMIEFTGMACNNLERMLLLAVCGSLCLSNGSCLILCGWHFDW